MDRPLRLLHLTDLHLREAVPGTAEIARRRSREVGALLDRLEAMLPELAPDAVAITGDLLHAPYGLYRGADRFGMAALRAHVLADYRALKARFERWARPWIALPGNHDDPESFAAVFGPPRVLDVHGHRLIAFHDREGPGHVPFRPAEEMARFDAALADADSPPQVHLQHYVLHPEVQDPYPHNYGDRAALLQAMGGSGRVALSVAGHYHAGGGPEAVGGTAHLVGRALCEAPHPVALITLGAGGAVAVQEIPLAPAAPAGPAGAAVIARDRLLDRAADFHRPDSIRLAPDLPVLADLRPGDRLICDASLDRPDLAGLDWPRLADAHDLLHARLAERGVVLDGLYYTTARDAAAAARDGLPRITLAGEAALAAAIARDFAVPVQRQRRLA